LPTTLFVDNYIVVDGIFFQTFCHRDPHVNFADHDEVVGSVDCPVE